MGYPQDLRQYNGCVSLDQILSRMEREYDAHVSHRIGNSLCSHPALLISDFGGICDVGLRLKIRKLRKVEVSVSLLWHW